MVKITVGILKGEWNLLLCLLFTVILLKHGVNSYSGALFNGDDEMAACDNRTPGHDPVSPVAFVVDPNPFKITINSPGYLQGQPITVTLRDPDGRTLKGFLVQAIQESDTTNPTPISTRKVGEFTVLNMEQQKLNCAGRGGKTITHARSTEKASVSFNWTAPSTLTENIRFRFAVVQDYDTFWSDQESDIFQLYVPPDKDCEPGRYYDEGTGSCHTCTRGYYTDQYNQTSCTECPDGTTTASHGATSANNCSKDGNQAAYIFTYTAQLVTANSSEVTGDCINAYGLGILNTIGSVTATELTKKLDSTFKGSHYKFYQYTVESFGPTDLTMVNLTLQFRCHAIPGTDQQYANMGQRIVAELVPGGEQITLTRDGLAVENCPELTLDLTGPASGEFTCLDEDETIIEKTDDNRCFACPENGTDPKTCELCTEGTYRTVGEDKLCTPCPLGYTTPTNGSISRIACTINIDECMSSPCQNEASCGDRVGYYECTCVGRFAGVNCELRLCEAGYYYNDSSNDCSPCAVGTYLNETDHNETSCTVCPDQYTTLNTMSVQEDDCLLYCDAGYEEVLGAENDTCTACPAGSYKNTTAPGDSCVSCAPYTTVSEAATAVDYCSVYNCTAGYQPNATNDGCELCPKGTYQDEYGQRSCIDCPTGKTTRTPGADNQTLCEVYCEGGYEEKEAGCVPCAKGFYKETEEPGDMCVLCTEEYTTRSTGSDNSTLCNLYNCTAGYQPNINNTGCDECPIGTYQSDPGEAKCVSCLGSTTTLEEGQTSSSACIAYCEPGYEQVGTSCVPCEKGYYKESTVPGDQCLSCTPYTTTSTGARNRTKDCVIWRCTAGNQPNSTNDGCEPCPRSTYQPDAGEPSCVKCPSATFSLESGLTDKTKCINEPLVTSVAPLYGPVAGGTKITFTGRNFYADETRVFLGYTIECEIITSNSTHVVARTPNVTDSEIDKRVIITIETSDKHNITINQTFTYMSNPDITKIYPITTIREGGLTLTVEGSHFNSVAHPILVVTAVISNVEVTNGVENLVEESRESYQQECSVSNDTILLCLTPELNLPEDVVSNISTSRRKRDTNPLTADRYKNHASDIYSLVGIANRMAEWYDDLTSKDNGISEKEMTLYQSQNQDNVLFRSRRDVSRKAVLLYIKIIFDGLIKDGEKNQLPQKRLELRLTPTFDFGDKQTFKFKRGGSIDIKGERVDRIPLSEYNVDVGNGSCEITGSSSDSLTCKPPQKQPERKPDSDTGDGKYIIMISIGENVREEVGILDYNDITAYIVGGVVGGVALLVIIIVLIVLLILRKRRNKKEKQRQMMINERVYMPSVPVDYGMNVSGSVGSIASRSLSGRRRPDIGVDPLLHHNNRPDMMAMYPEAPDVSRERNGYLRPENYHRMSRNEKENYVMQNKKPTRRTQNDDRNELIADEELQGIYSNFRLKRSPQDDYLTEDMTGIGNGLPPRTHDGAQSNPLFKDNHKNMPKANGNVKSGRREDKQFDEYWENASENDTIGYAKHLASLFDNIDGEPHAH